jgi:manganese transport protein
MFAFAGPAYLISVGYMDPGNWATDLEGGARFGYGLLWVLVLSNLMAILLQTLSARLGIVSRKDLAQACRETYPRSVCNTLWLLCEIAIGACDLAEVLGAAIGLHLLFHIPLLAGVLITSLDTLLILWFTKFGIRIVEGFVLALITIIAGCFLVEIWLAKPNFVEIASGLIPTLNSQSLYIAIGILGATVMPHNLYLHGALVQTRRIGETAKDKRIACRYNLLDSVIALNGALLVNAAILILAGTVFWKRAIVVTQIDQAYLLLEPLLGTTLAGAAFAIALLCSGQSSTLTGTMAGQVVMEGFLNLRMVPWLRRLITRTLAVIPAAITVYVSGAEGTFKLLILSQVVLSMQLPFAVIPLINFTSDRKRMGEFANSLWVRILAWLCAAVIVVLNGWLLYGAAADMTAAAGRFGAPLAVVLWFFGLSLFLLMLWVTFEPVLPARLKQFRPQAAAFEPHMFAQEEVKLLTYHRILVPLDHSGMDRDAVAHAAAMARMHNAKVFLLHVEEGVTSQLYGNLASTSEVRAGQEYLDHIAESLRAQSIEVETVIVHDSKPRRAIIQTGRQIQPDLVIMGAHGHKGLKDLFFGTTINKVRHELNVPLLIVRKDVSL